MKTDSFTDNNSNADYRQIRRSWRQREEENASSLKNNERPLTRRELQSILNRNRLVSQLRRRAMLMGIVGFTGPTWIIALDAVQPQSKLLIVVYSVFMVACGCGSLYWWWRLGKVYHYMSIPLVAAQRKMAALDRLRRNIKITSWIVGAPVIVLLFYELAAEHEPSMLKGAIVGAIIGLGIGLTIEFLNRKQVRSIRKSFDNEFRDPELDEEYEE